jgi:purine nucleosidase
MIPGSLLDELRDTGNIAGVHLHRITQNYLDIYGMRRGQRECAMHDALALGIAADPSLVLESRKVRVDVELAGTHTRGMTVGDFRPWVEHPNANVTVVLEADRQRFIDRWTEVIRGA